ncbi:hypothetical protein J4216_02555 [Candidatus Woesearchaeota archaeon]|nr:hypothetical protein [Candidatus Woesearchaeota archaeon]
MVMTSFYSGKADISEITVYSLLKYADKISKDTTCFLKEGPIAFSTLPEVLFYAEVYACHLGIDVSRRISEIRSRVTALVGHNKQIKKELEELV